ncbi:MAG: helix-turn-helix domain-containing protein [bacterium]|nr:helix-turn-helix domain-containing protein [bacterium]
MEAATGDRLRDLIAALSARVTAGTVRIVCSGDRRADGRPDENLSAAEAAKRLGVSRSWLYSNAHGLPFTRHIGRRVLFSAQGLDRWSRDRQR